ncbi:MAG: hypothetical protein ACREQ3_27360, partial [Candidatus Binatia bacterium]
SDLHVPGPRCGGRPAAGRERSSESRPEACPAAVVPAHGRDWSEKVVARSRLIAAPEGQPVHAAQHCASTCASTGPEIVRFGRFGLRTPSGARWDSYGS